MAHTFDLFKTTKLGELKLREEQYTRTIKNIFWIIVVSLVVIGNLKTILPAQFDLSQFVSMATYIAIGLAGVIVIYYRHISKDKLKSKLTTKETILVNFYEARVQLKKALEEKSPKELKKALDLFSNIEREIKYLGNADGFNFGNKINRFVEEFIIFLSNIENIRINLSQNEILELDGTLLNIFVNIQDEEFTKITEILQEYNKKYKKQDISKIKETIKKFELIEKILNNRMMIIEFIVLWLLFGLILFYITNNLLKLKLEAVWTVSITASIAASAGILNLIQNKNKAK